MISPFTTAGIELAKDLVRPGAVTAPEIDDLPGPQWLTAEDRPELVGETLGEIGLLCFAHGVFQLPVLIPELFHQ